MNIHDFYPNRPGAIEAMERPGAKELACGCTYVVGADGSYDVVRSCWDLYVNVVVNPPSYGDKYLDTAVGDMIVDHLFEGILVD